MFRGNRPRNRLNVGVLLLLYQMLQYGFNRIPPITLLTIVGNVWVYLYKPFSVNKICISAYHVWYRKEYYRIFYSAVHHLSDIHLYYNMSSFLIKASFLERKFKSVYFVFLLAMFTGLCGVFYVALSVLFTRLMEEPSHISQCAAGFSGVIFALKVLTTHYAPEGQQTLLGIIPLPSKWVVWAELLIIQFLVPNSSFTGHLAGILVGCFYLHSPLKSIMDAIVPTGDSYTSQRSNFQYTRPFRGEGHATGYGRGDADDLGQSRRAYGSYNTYEYYS